MMAVKRLKDFSVTAIKPASLKLGIFYIHLHVVYLSNRITWKILFITNDYYESVPYKHLVNFLFISFTSRNLQNFNNFCRN